MCKIKYYHKGEFNMNIKKRIIVILTLIITTMLIVPLITINTVKADAGMLVALLLFFAINPCVSIVVGILSGKDIKHFWFTPILIAVLFWVFSSFTYKTAFPVVYSLSYFIICAISLLITWLIVRTK